MSNELAIIEQDSPAIRFGVGRDVAALCREIVLKTSMHIDGSKKKHVCVEGWQSIAAAWGCTPEIISLEFDEDGVRAKAQLKRDSDGAILSSAYGYCSGKEKTKKGNVRFSDQHAVEGMAQTRAISRVCANKFRFVVVLISDALSATPAEEMLSDQPQNPVHETQELEGELKEVWDKKNKDGDRWIYGIVNGVRFSTKRPELGKAIFDAQAKRVRVRVKKMVLEGGKIAFRPEHIEILPYSPTDSEISDAEQTTINNETDNDNE